MNDIEIIKDFLRDISPTTRVYIGCDSTNTKRNTLFTIAVVAHYDGCHGAKLFHMHSQEPRIQSRNQRLMKEIHLAVGTALELLEVLDIERMEVHADINVSPRHASNAVYTQAKSYIQGQGLVFKFKPEAFAASSAADHLVRRRGETKRKKKARR